MGKKKMLMRKFGSVAIVNNTFIGGVASVINTPALLAAKLQYYPSGAAFNENDIQNFTINGSDIECYIGVDYQIKEGSFKSTISDITYYYDYLSCKLIGAGSFSNYSNTQHLKKVIFTECLIMENIAFSSPNHISELEEVIFPKLTTMNGNQHFVRAERLNLVYMPKITKLGDTVGSDSIFLQSTLNKKVYVNPILESIDNGSPDGDLLEELVTPIYVTSFTAPNVVTDLAVSEVYGSSIVMTLTPPTSANAIDYYEVYVDGVFYKKEPNSIFSISGLTNLQTYSFTVIVVDIFYNKSLVSNSVTQQINGTNLVFSDHSSIISYYKLENNTLDAFGLNNGTPTDLSYKAGQVGSAGVFNGVSSIVDCTNDISFQITTGSISCVIKANNSGLSYRGIVVKPLAYGLFMVDGVLSLFSWASPSGLKTTGININDDKWHKVILTFNNTVTNGTKIYLDGVLVLTTTIGISSQVNNLLIGSGTTSSEFINASIDEVSIFNKALSQVEVTEITNLHLAGLPLI